ncbi:hypothetical protein PR048_011541 [Dryococelus australis]|uniref:Uncharacterized protein n=1 Tax=Dryococelus australis TaxID=614101 RepID=A0ABQ9HLS8_9NEOP|nr:hypothetical protein PR048_011541 [Dryococelus australis]
MADMHSSQETYIVSDLPSLYATHPPIAPVKKKDLQQLMPFVKPENRRFYEDLISGETREVTWKSQNAAMEISSDNSSGCNEEKEDSVAYVNFLALVC